MLGMLTHPTTSYKTEIKTAMNSVSSQLSLTSQHTLATNKQMMKELRIVRMSSKKGWLDVFLVRQSYLSLLHHDPPPSLPPSLHPHTAMTHCTVKAQLKTASIRPLKFHFHQKYFYENVIHV